MEIYLILLYPQKVKCFEMEQLKGLVMKYEGYFTPKMASLLVICSKQHDFLSFVVHLKQMFCKVSRLFFSI